MSQITAEQSRDNPSKRFADLFKDCPAVSLLTFISNRWVGVTLGTLGARGVMRHGQIARTIPGVSQKMLTQTLRALERDGMVVRTATPTVPPTVYYELTDLGSELFELLLSVKHWAELNTGRIERARQCYDENS
ncbi:helix-turn-helix domain-containing protein [Amycolatopsis sp. NPDC023774]|uniref:winged helix-turn-helix transcriptional regulator n=1 Tax=Amycolatopsis sp. NPDC023774 TaxID=3155015 RepID=UPI003402D3C6